MWHLDKISDPYFFGLTATAWGAIATFLAVVVALFQERIKEFFTRATLKVEIMTSPPDSHRILLQSSDGIIPSIYIRIRVTNTGGRAAERVEIMISNFWAVESDGSRTKLTTFLPLNLKWSHFAVPTAHVRIPRGLFRFCDLGSVRPHRQPSTDRCLLLLDTIVQPNPVGDNVVPNMFGPEHYEFELILTGDNVSPLVTKWSLVFDNFWSNEESTMLQHISIKEIK